MRTLRLVLANAILVAISDLEPAHAQSMEVQGGALYGAGRPFTDKGIHYGPWGPGTGPNKGYPYPGPQQVEADLKLIHSLNANTILVADAPDYVLDLAAKYNLRVLYSIFVQWWTIGTNNS